jgi:uncharacterized membrane protein HdeD (DUF308 family)
MQKKDYFRFYISIILAAIGIFTIFSPAHAMFAVVIILGIVFIVWGAVMLIRQFNSRSPNASLFDNAEDKKKSSLPHAVQIIISLLLLIAGILLLVFSTPAKDVFIPVIIGFWALITGVFATINAISFYRKHQDALLSVIALIVSFTTAIALFAFSSAIPGFTSPGGGVFLLVFGFITAIEIAISSRKKNVA